MYISLLKCNNRVSLARSRLYTIACVQTACFRWTIVPPGWSAITISCRWVRRNKGENIKIVLLFKRWSISTSEYHLMWNFCQAGYLCMFMRHRCISREENIQLSPTLWITHENGNLIQICNRLNISIIRQAWVSRSLKEQ